MAAVTIIDVSGFVSLWRVSRAECVLAVVATTGVVVLGVLYGIVIAVALSIAVALANIARPHDAVLGDMPDVDGWVDVNEYPAALTSPGLVVFRFDAPLFFVNAERFSDRVQQVLADNPGDEEWLVMDCEGIRRARRIGGRDAGRVDRPSANGGGGGHRGESERTSGCSIASGEPACSSRRVRCTRTPPSTAQCGRSTMRIVKPFTRHAVG